jgi:UDP-N-acetylmuramoyl-tripeptide--D-alanyl-D-alanine ligase
MEIQELYRLFLKNPIITTDTRKIETGAIFFALKGESFNGNKYAQDAIKKGCSFAIIDDKDVPFIDGLILVDNVLNTLQELASFHRKQLNIPIIAITGTNGKTTTKELIASVLKTKFNVSFTQGNLNNHIGVPLTLLSMTNSTEIGVIEMGANHVGEIKELCKIVDPNYGIITNIGKAHIDGFGSYENIIKAKKELYDYLKENDGKVFVNEGNDLLSKLVNELELDNVSYNHPKSKVKVKGESLPTNKFLKAKVNINDVDHYLETQLIGSYNLENVLAAICVGHYFKVSDDKIIESIKEYVPQNNRSQFIKTESNNLIVDCYNANPTSVKAALENFISLDFSNKCVILGDMLELGNVSEKEHKMVVDFVIKQDFKHIILVGDIYFLIDVPINIKQFKTVEELNNWISLNKIYESNVLIKGSRGIQLERVIENL